MLASIWVKAARGAALAAVLASTPAAYATDVLPSLEWGDLEALDYETGRVSGFLQELDEALVRIPGFMLPTAGDMNEITEFFLMPDVMYCMHVPPPPPNQMVYVRLEEPYPADEYSLAPVWVTGKLSIIRAQSEYGEAGFEMLGTRVEPYDEWD